MFKTSKLINAATDKQTSDVTLTLTDADNNELTVFIPRRVADQLLIALLATPLLARADGKTSAHRAPLQILGSHPLQSEGSIGLALQLSDTAAVQIAFPREAIPVLQRQLQALLEDHQIH